MTGRHRAARRLGRFALPALATFALWLADNDPAGPVGLAGFTVLGVTLGLLYPVLLIFALQAPGSLVPRRWRTWWRHGQDHRPAIPAWLRRVVLAADRHSCCFCKSSQQLQVDHVFPWSLGGRTTLWNCMTLCGPCNRVKSNYWVHPSGRVTYNPFEGHGWPERARRILQCELNMRKSPIRLIRAAIAL